MADRLISILGRISEIISQTADCGEALSRIVDILAEKLRVNVCSIYICKEREGVLELAATHGLHRESVGRVSMRPGEGLAGKSFQSAEIINISNPEKHPDFVYFNETGEEKYKSFLAVPLTLAGKGLGVLTLQSSKPQKFSRAIVEMTKALGTQLANLIMNARMLEELTKERDESGVVARDAAGKKGSQILLKGAAANQGLANGKALILETKDVFMSIPHMVHTNAEEELRLLKASIELTKERTVEVEKKALTFLSEADASIFYTHLLFLDDKTLLERMTREILNNSHALEYAIKLIFLDYLKRFNQLSDQAFRDRFMDFKDVFLGLLESVRILKGQKDGARRVPDAVNGKKILLSEEILPSDLMRMPLGNIAGIVCEKGGVTAHVAILAKALDIPAMMGVKELITNARDDDEVILDCHAEILYLRPSEDTRRHFKDMMSDRSRRMKTDLARPKKGARTLDGHKITLRANLSLICETELLKRYGAEGVGLYRTEFLFMIRDHLPSEEDQFNVYSKVVRECGGQEVSIRVLDIGADKPLPYLNVPFEENPAMGCRGIRTLLGKRELLKTQLKAILRAGQHGKLKILFPMVSTMSELLEAKKILAEASEELKEKKVRHSEDFKVGIMLEVPSVVFALDSLIKEVDFMSVGSNDLLQYTFAIDRGNENVSGYYQPFHPAFIRILHEIGRTFAGKEGKELSICGEMAGDPRATPVLIGAGIRDLSMAPRQIPSVRRVAGAFSAAECEKLLKSAMEMKNHESVRCLLNKAFSEKRIDTTYWETGGA